MEHREKRLLASPQATYHSAPVVHCKDAPLVQRGCTWFWTLLAVTLLTSFLLFGLLVHQSMANYRVISLSLLQPLSTLRAAPTTRQPLNTLRATPTTRQVSVVPYVLRARTLPSRTSSRTAPSYERVRKPLSSPLAAYIPDFLREIRWPGSDTISDEVGQEVTIVEEPPTQEEQGTPLSAWSQSFAQVLKYPLVVIVTITTFLALFAIMTRGSAALKPLFSRLARKIIRMLPQTWAFSSVIVGLSILAGWGLGVSLVIALTLAIPYAAGKFLAGAHHRLPFMSTSFRDCMKEVQQLLVLLKKDFELEHPLAVNLFLYYAYQQQKQKKEQSESDVESPKMEDEFKKASEGIKQDMKRVDLYLRFASSAYGPVLNAVLTGNLEFLTPTEGLPEEGRHELHTIQYLTGLLHENVLRMDLEGEVVLHPRHFLAVSHTEKAIILAIRGTMNVSDVMTDIVAQTVPFLDGYAHSGFAEGATNVYNDNISLIKDQLGLYPGYNVVVCGHSLGGATATLVTMMLKSNGDIGGNVPVQCYAFAPPPAYGPIESVPEHISQSINNFICNDDIVPRLSVYNLLRFMDTIEALDNMPLGLRDRMSFIASADSEVRDLVQVVKDHTAVHGMSKFRDETLPLDMIGAIHWLEPGSLEIKARHHLEFRDLKMASTIVKDHLHPTYMDAIKDIKDHEEYDWIEDWA